MCCGHAAARIKSQGTTALSLSLSPPLFSTPPINPLDIPYSRFSFFSPCNSPPTMARVSSRKEKEKERELRGITTRGRRIILGMHVPPLDPSLLFLSPRWQTAILIHRSAMLAIFFMRQPLFPTGTSPKGGWIVRGQDYLSSRERFVYVERG